MAATFVSSTFAYGPVASLPAVTGSVTFYYATDTGDAYELNGGTWEIITIWNAGRVLHLGSGLSLSGTTLSATGSGGSVTNVATSGAGISGGPITGSGTLTVEWNAGTVTALGPNLAINSGSLDIVGITGGSLPAAGAIGELALANGGASSSSTVTISNASPTVITWSGHPFSRNVNGAVPVQFTTTGSLPTGLAINTIYWAVPINTTTFHVATTPANAFAGTFIATSSAGSGTQTCEAYISVGSNSPFTVAAVQLTAGTWAMSGGTFCNSSGATISAAEAGFSASLNSGTTYYGDIQGFTETGASGAGNNQVADVATFRITVSSTTIIYLFANPIYTSGSVLISGYAQATRVG